MLSPVIRNAAILIADDDETSARYLKRLLSRVVLATTPAAGQPDEECTHELLLELPILPADAELDSDPVRYLVNDRDIGAD